MIVEATMFYEVSMSSRILPNQSNLAKKNSEKFSHVIHSQKFYGIFRLVLAQN